MKDDFSDSPDSGLKNVELLRRTKDFGVRTIRLVRAMPRDTVGKTLGRQLLRSGTSIGANYHEATHASSDRHFVTLMEIAQREARETYYWLQLIGEGEVMPPSDLKAIRSECSELIAIFTASLNTLEKKRKAKQQSQL